jgi:ribosomal protein L12E/L44/L45/RPP1/RPP2
MPADTERLINELLTRVGMIMEDTTVTALVRSSKGGDVRRRIKSLERSASSITSLVNAAKALTDG